MLHQAMVIERDEVTTSAPGTFFYLTMLYLVFLLHTYLFIIALILYKKQIEPHITKILATSLSG